MTITQIIGGLMLLIPFIAFFTFIAVIERNWKVPAAVFAITLAIVAFLATGTYLMMGVIP